MNNKIFKRIVAAAAGVAMLGTCAFATTLADVTFEKDTLSFTYEVASGASKVTYLAYAATEAGADDTNVKTIGDVKYVLGNIIAVNQLDEIPETKSEAVAISAELLGDAPYIILMSGDDLGSDVAEVAITTAPAVTTYTVSFEIAAELELTAPAAIATTTGKATLPEAPAKDGYTFDGWYLAATPETLVAAGTEVDVTGDVTYIAKYTEIPAGPAYTVSTKNDAFKSLLGAGGYKILRFSGLDDTYVVTVDGVVAKYYKTPDGDVVHIVGLTPDQDPTSVVVAKGAPTKIVFGDVVNPKNNVNALDITNFRTNVAKSNFSQDINTLLVWDINGEGTTINAMDTTALRTGVSKGTTSSMNCYKKK